LSQEDDLTAAGVVQVEVGALVLAEDPGDTREGSEQIADARHVFRFADVDVGQLMIHDSKSPRSVQIELFAERTRADF
jgi:hypothetical protein